MKCVKELIIKDYKRCHYNFIAQKFWYTHYRRVKNILVAPSDVRILAPKYCILEQISDDSFEDLWRKKT